MKKRFLFLLLFPLFLQAEKLEIIATADLHGEIGNLARLAPLFREHPDAVKVDAGDLAQGNPVMAVSGGFAMIRALNALSYDLFVPGNHDFEWGESLLARWQRSFAGTVLCAQCRSKDFTPRPFILLKRGNFRCVFIGLTEHKIMQFPALLPEYRIKKDTLGVLDETLAEIRKLSPAPDAVILIWHNGRYSGCGTLGKILSEHPEIDAVICAHTHEELPGAKAGRAVIVQPGGHGEAAVLLTLHTDPKYGKRFTSELLRPQKTADAAVVALEDAAEGEAEKVFSRPLGDFPSAERFAGKAAETLCRAMACDAALFDVPENFAGSMTQRDYFSAFRYNNRYFSVTISAEELKKAAADSPGKGRRRICFIRHPDAPQLTAAVSDYLLRSSPALRRAKISILKPGVTEWQIPALLFR